MGLDGGLFRSSNTILLHICFCLTRYDVQVVRIDVRVGSLLLLYKYEI